MAFDRSPVFTFACADFSISRKGAKSQGGTSRIESPHSRLYIPGAITPSTGEEAVAYLFFGIRPAW